jgi:hypothetical protein
MLLDELDARVAAGQGTRVGDDWWQRLAPRIDAIDSPLAAAVAGAVLVHAAEDEQQRLMRRAVSHAACGPDPWSAVPEAVAALWRRRRPSQEELGLLGELLPDGPELPGWVFDSLSRELLDESPLTRTVLNLAHNLVACGLFRPAAPVRRLLDSDRDLDTACEDLPLVASDDLFRRCVDGVRRADPRVVEVWGKRLIRSLLEVEQPVWVPVLLKALPAEIGQAYRDRLLAAVRKPGRPGHVCMAFYLSLHPKMTDRTELIEGVVSWIARSSPRQQQPVQQLVAELGGRWPERWTEFQEIAKQVRPRRRLPRRRVGD